MPKEGKVIVKGVSVATKHQKARKQGQESSIIKVETPIYACKVMVVCPSATSLPASPTRSATTARRSASASTAARSCKEGASMNQMKELYVKEVAPALMQKFQYKSSMQIPRIDKIVVSVGCGDCKDNAKALDAVIKDISAITGQKAVATVARKSVANFKLREGMHVGVKVTLRHERMWDFLNRLFNVALPRVRDFRGISPDALRRPWQLLPRPQGADNLPRD